MRQRIRSTRRNARGRPKILRLLQKSQHMRRWHLNNPWCRPLLILNYAAVIIQKAVRGHISRLIRARPTQQKKKKRSGAGNYQLDKYLAQIDYYKMTKKIRPKWLDDGFSSWCAVQIQALWRMHRANRRYVMSRMMMYQIAALTVQSVWKIHQFNKRRAIGKLIVTNHISIADVNDRSALSIQSCWRSFCSRRIFKYFSDLIRLKLKGAPAELLRSIIPGESGLLDFASGTHVRFRLGGHTFPPSIYFKIYTHRPLCDINAFAPRDYSKEKKPEGLRFNSSINNTPGTLRNTRTGKSSCQSREKSIKVGAQYFNALVTTTVSMDQWYKREENNPWRPIASQIMSDLVTPPWSRDEISKPLQKKVNPFHFSRLRRQADLNAERKRKKREWMSKAHMIAKHGENSDNNQDELENNQPESKDIYRTEPNTYNNTGHDSKGYHNPYHSNPSDYRSDDRNSSDRADEKWYSGRDEYKSDLQYRNGSGHDHKLDTESLEEKMNEASLENLSYLLDENGNGGDGNYNGGAISAENQDNEFYYYNNPSRGNNTFNVNNNKNLEPVQDDSDLLKWSLALDFTEYSHNWQTMATSLPSDNDGTKNHKQNQRYGQGLGPTGRRLDLGTY